MIFTIYFVIFLQAMLPRPMSSKKHRARQLVSACFCQYQHTYLDDSKCIMMINDMNAMICTNIYV